MKKILTIVLVVASATLANAQAAEETNPPSLSLQAPRRVEQLSQPSGTAVFKGEDGEALQLQPAADEERPVNTLTKGHITLTDNETGQTIADGDIKIIERWGSINVIQGSVFTCAPTNGMVNFGDFQGKGKPTYATLEFVPPNRWKVLDANFYVVSEFVQTGPLTTQNILTGGPVKIDFINDKSITRASMIAVPKGNHTLFGYKVVVPSDNNGQVTFRLGKILSYENCQIELYSGPLPQYLLMPKEGK